MKDKEFVYGSVAFTTAFFGLLVPWASIFYYRTSAYVYCDYGVWWNPYFLH